MLFRSKIFPVDFFIVLFHFLIGIHTKSSLIFPSISDIFDHFGGMILSPWKNICTFLSTTTYVYSSHLPNSVITWCCLDRYLASIITPYVTIWLL